MKKLITSSLAVLLVFGACEITDLNNNPKAPTNIPGDPLFSNAQVAMGNFLVSELKYMPQHWTSTTYTSTVEYEIHEANIPNSIWSTLYSDVLVNLHKAKVKIKKNNLLAEEVKQNKLACIEVMMVLAFHKLVDIFGNVPYSEALNPDNLQPDFDEAATIYLDLLSRLNAAIDQFNTSAEGFGNADIYYNGDISKWVKFANSLKMRLAITMADVKPSIAQTAIEEASPNAFSSNADNALIPYTSTPPNTNPVWEALVQSGRHDNLPARPLISRMNDLNDPRRAVQFTKINGEYRGGIYGQVNDWGDYSHFSELVKTSSRPGMIMGYAEVEFIRAEAAARGYNIRGSAASHYRKAITADMKYWGISQSEIDAYLAQPQVAYATAPGTALEKIGLQKWIALFLQGLQAWTVVRRLDTPDLKAPEGAPVNEYPSRFTYPSLSAVLNPENFKEAVDAIGGDLLTTNIFWDVD